MKKSTRINILLTVSAIVISLVSLIYTYAQDRKIQKIQYELNATNYKPIIKVDSVEFKSFNEKIDSAVVFGELNDSTGLMNLYTRVFANVTFHLKNVGNTNAKICLVLCLDTIYGGDKARELFFKEGGKLNPDFSDKEFYLYRQLQSDDIDRIEFNTEIFFIEDDTFVIHFLVFYENDLNNLYDTYYWAKFQIKTLITSMTPIMEAQNNTQKMIVEKNHSVFFIDDNISYKNYGKNEKNQFDWILKQFINAR